MPYTSTLRTHKYPILRPARVVEGQHNYQLPITNYQLPITNYQLPQDLRRHSICSVQTTTLAKHSLQDRTHLT